MSRRRPDKGPETFRQSGCYEGWDAAAAAAEAPTVVALYDCAADDAGELSFRAGDIIELLDASDENWHQGRHTRTGELLPAGGRGMM